MGLSSVVGREIGAVRALSWAAGVFEDVNAAYAGGDTDLSARLILPQIYKTQDPAEAGPWDVTVFRLL